MHATFQSLVRWALVLICLIAVASYSCSNACAAEKQAKTKSASQDSKQSADPAANEAEQILSGVHWAGLRLDMSALHGKTVLVLCYATWCPICNGWSPEFCKQLKASVADKPIVVMAINNDETPDNARPYMTKLDFIGPNILHGYDPQIHKKAGIDQLWSYMMIDPEGKISERGHAGSFFGQGAEKQFVLPKQINEMKHVGTFMIINRTMSSDLKEAFWPMEVGLNSLAADARKRLDNESQQKFDQAIRKFLGNELNAIHKLAGGDLDDRFQAYDRARAVTTNYKGLEPKGSDLSKDARKVTLALENDKKFGRELTARKAYEKIESTVPPEKRPVPMKRLAKSFPGTEYGEKAAAAAN